MMEEQGVGFYIFALLMLLLCSAGIASLFGCLMDSMKKRAKLRRFKDDIAGLSSIATRDQVGYQSTSDMLGCQCLACRPRMTFPSRLPRVRGRLI